MVKVIVQRRVNKLEDVWSLLRQLRIEAIHHPGYISGETLQQQDDPSTIITISSWSGKDSWDSWEKSAKRAEMYKKIQPFLKDKPAVTVYEVIGSGK
jgi:quinol monooxygenase YgiN